MAAQVRPIWPTTAWPANKREGAVRVCLTHSPSPGTAAAACVWLHRRWWGGRPDGRRPLVPPVAADRRPPLFSFSFSSYVAPWCSGLLRPPAMAGRLAPGGEPQCGGAPGVVPDAGTAVHGRDVAKRGCCAADAAT
jgi:hypothetical protein